MRPERVTNLQPVDFADLPAWTDEDCAGAFAAFRVGAALIVDRPPKTRAFGIDGAALSRIARRALDAGEKDACEFFERWFAPLRIDAPGFVTGYYEPEVAASRLRTDRFRVPIYRRPPELVEVSEAERPAEWNPDVRFARRSATGFEAFFDRAAIEEGALAGRGLELAFVEDPVDAFFIHVQGSARLRLVEGPAAGGTLRVGFDGKSGHPYTAIGRVAVDRGLLDLARADKDGLEAWLKAHRRDGQSLMRENRSFIFFRETPLGEEGGPVGASGVPLTPMSSLAVDRTLHTFQTPIFVTAEGLDDPVRGEPFRRLMIAQDTGSAILGPARGDIFFGSGSAAGSAAGRVRHASSMVLLAPKAGA